MWNMWNRNTHYDKSLYGLELVNCIFIFGPFYIFTIAKIAILKMYLIPI